MFGKQIGILKHPGYNGKGDAPPAPDYTGAAQATAAGNLEAARATAAANRVNQYTPYGNLEYSTRGTDAFGNELYNVTQTLTPAEQQKLNQSNALDIGLLNTAQTGLNYAQGVLGKPGVDMSTLTPLQSSVSGNIPALKSSISTSGLPSTGLNPGETYSDAIMRRLQPQMAQEKESFDSQMANQGIAPGTQAYENAARVFQQGQNDKLTSAIVGGMQTGLAANQQQFGQNAQQAALANAANQQAYSQALQNAQLANQIQQQQFNQASYNQMQPINVINALRTGTQVNPANYVNPVQQANPGGADLLGATQAGYQAQLGQYNANQAANAGFFGGLMGLGGLGVKAYGAGLFG